MSRSKTLNVQTPGAVPAAAATAGGDDAAGMTATELQAQAAEATAAEDSEQTRDLTAGGDDVAALKAQLAALQAKNAELEADLASKAKSNIVYTPDTPHGLERLATSATAGMTVAQVMAAIDAGRLDEPMTSYLCADGNYCRRR